MIVWCGLKPGWLRWGYRRYRNLIDWLIYKDHACRKTPSKSASVYQSAGDSVAPWINSNWSVNAHRCYTITGNCKAAFRSGYSACCGQRSKLTKTMRNRMPLFHREVDVSLAQGTASRPIVATDIPCASHILSMDLLNPTYMVTMNSELTCNNPLWSSRLDTFKSPYARLLGGESAFPVVGKFISIAQLFSGSQSISTFPFWLRFHVHKSRIVLIRLKCILYYSSSWTSNYDYQIVLKTNKNVLKN